VPEFVFGLRSQSTLFLGQVATGDPHRAPPRQYSRSA
jgi:hypothetical protein